MDELGRETEAHRVACIGAGLSGLVCALQLQQAGRTVTVFEKSRGVGGRMSTRRTSAGDFDHGAQYFTVKHPEFQAAVDYWQAAGLVKRWQPKVAALEAGRIETVDATPFYVGVPTMTAVAKHLASALSICLETRIARIERSEEGWLLFDLDGQRHGPYAELVISAPAPQTAALVRSKTPLAETLAAAKLQPCWAVLAGFADRLPLPFDGLFFNDADSPLSWAARMGSKPERDAAPDRWVLHATGDWSERHLEDQPARAEAALWQAFTIAVSHAIPDSPLPKPAFLTAHRWRYAYVATPLEIGSLFDPIRRIGICGDWCQSGRVEGAFLSGRHLAAQMLESAPL